MERGQRVIVRAYPDKLLHRRVWQEYKTYVEVCREEVYWEAIRRKGEPESTIGFPKEDVFLDEEQGSEAA